MLVEPPRSCALLVAPLLLTLGCNREEPRHVELTLTANLPTVTIATAQATPEPPPRAPWPRRDSGEKRGTLVYSKVRFLWIRPVPRASADWIGYLSLGDSVPLRGSRDEAFVRVATEGACEAWYAVEPRGYVCAGDQVSSFDPDDPDVVALRKTVANFDSPWPYRYGESTGTPVYLEVPPHRRQRSREARLEKHLDDVARVRAGESPASVSKYLVGVDLTPATTDPPRSLLHLGPRSTTYTNEVVLGSTIAWSHDFVADERSWLLTWDRGIVPKDRVKVYPESTFAGVELDDEVRLPLAFFRSDHVQYRMVAGRAEATEGRWPKYSHVQLTGHEVEIDGTRYLETRQDDLWCTTEDVSAPRLREDIPPRIREQRGGRRTWIDVSILRGWMVAYEYDRPVYTTLVSPGRGGIPKRGVPPLETASTPLGRYRIAGKFVTATMVSGSNAKLVHAEVPYTQNFTGPYALHSAYWHDDWGVGKSGGCVNLSPIDAQRVFAWTEPQLPPGWHGMKLASGHPSSQETFAQATLISLHK